MKEVSQNKMGVMPVGKLIGNMAMPAIVAMLIQALYNMVDSIFVAQISPEALLSVSLAYPLQMLMISVAVGTGVGLNSLIARRLGEGNHEAAGRVVTHGLVLGALSGIAFLLAAVFVTVPYFHAFTQDEVVFAGGCSYTRIVLGCAVFCLISINVEKCIQATGNMVAPMIQTLSGAITNIILDPILIFGLLGAPKLGVTGAAIATIIGQAVSMSIGLFVLFKKKHVFTVSFHNFKLSGRVIREIYQVGFPSIIMQSITSVMITGMNAILAPISMMAVSVLGVYFKLQSFIFMPVFGLTQGAMPVMGYNFGARNKTRMVQAYKVTVVTAFFIMVAGTIIFLTIPDKLLMMFSADEETLQEMLEVGVPALRTICLSFVGAAFGIVNSTVFQAVGHGMANLMVSVARQLFIILPVAYFMAQFGGLHLVWYAFPIAEVIAVLFSCIMLARIYKNEIRGLSNN